MTHNPYLKDFQDQLKQRFAEEYSSMSYSDWILANTTLNKKKFTLSGYEFQRAILDDMSPNLAVIKCSQIGLCLDLNTPILTTKGWTTMGDIKVGDVIYDDQGNETNVTYISPIHVNRTCYKLGFDDGAELVADAEHRWYVEAIKPFNTETGFYTKSGRIPTNESYNRSGVVNTDFLSKHYLRNGKPGFRIPLAPALKATHVDLPLDPYFLGLWLGNGHSYSASLTQLQEDLEFILPELEKRGFTSRQVGSAGRGITVNLHLPHPGGPHRNAASTALKELGVLKNKHIPWVYHSASPDQRMELLQGLLDSDGHISGNSRAGFSNTNVRLMEDVALLARSLGFKVYTRWRETAQKASAQTACGRTIQSKLPIGEHHFTVYAEDKVFKLPRKLDQIPRDVNFQKLKTSSRLIVSVEPIETRPMRCITVDSPSHLYLAGHNLIPTHNTESQLRKFAAFLARNNGTKGIFTLPDDIMTKRISQTRFGPMISNDQVFNHASKPIRSIDLTQINQSYAYFVGGKESAATSIDADILFHDETDLSDQEMLALFQSRLQGSDWRITQSFSTPTFEGYGIDALFRVSDQHEYLIKCACCGHWNNPRWSPKHVRLAGLSSDADTFFDLDAAAIDALDLSPDASYIFCTKCTEPLDVHDAELRQWVPKFPGRRNRGYKVTPFAVPKLTVPYILDQQQKYAQRDAMRRFHNTVLGEPFNDEKARMSELDIRACMVQPSRPDISPLTPVILGLDMGLVCHLTMATLTAPQINVFHWEPIPEHNLIDRLKELQSIYRILGGAVDRYPYTPLSNEIRDLFNGTVMPVEYSTNGPDLTVSKDELGSPSHVRGNRTTILDTISTAVRKKHWVFTGYGNQDAVIVQHLRDMVRIEKDDQSVSWNKLTGTDHYFHSLGYLGFAQKIHQHQLHNSEQRHLIDYSSVIVKNRSDDNLAIKGRVSSPISLGALS